MSEVTKSKVFKTFTYLLFFASALTVIVSYAVGLHHWVEGLVMFASICSIGWIGVLVHLANSQ